MPFIPDQTAASPEQQPIASSGFVPDKEQPKASSIKDYLEAPITGGFHMFDSLATTLLKAGAKYGILPGVPSDAIQAAYDSNSKDFNKSMQDHPYLTGAGAVAGGILEAAPTMLIPGMQGAGIGSLAAVGKLATNAVSQAGQMGILGGLSTSEGQDSNQILNPENAKTGALFGAAGAGASAVIGNTIEGAAKLYQAQKAAPGMKIFSSDLPTNSVIGNAWKWVVNNALGNLPSKLGTQGGRELQTQQAQKMIADHLTQVAQDTAKSGPQRISTILQSHNNELNNTENKLWNNFTSQVPANNVERTESLPVLKNILEDPNQIQQLTTGKGGELQGLRQGLQANNPVQMAAFKDDVWKVIDRLATKDSKAGLSAGEQTLLNNAKELYGSNINDLKNAIKGIDGQAPALQVYEAANQFTKNFRSTLGNVPTLQKAIADAHDQVGKVSDFVRWMKAPSTSVSEIKQASSILGNSGTNEIGGQIVQDAFKDAQTTIGKHTALDINKLLNNFSDIEQSAQAGIAKPALQALEGWRNALQQVAEAQAHSGGTAAHGLSGLGVVGGSIAAIAHGNPVAAGVLAATPAVLSWFAKNSPIKNSIIWLNKSIKGDNAPLNSYLLNKIQRTMINGGIITDIQSNGDINLQHKDDLPKKTTKLQQISLNDNSPFQKQEEKGFAPIPKQAPRKMFG